MEEENINGRTLAEFVAIWKTQDELTGWLWIASNLIFGRLDIHPEKQKALGQKTEVQEFYRRYAHLEYDRRQERLKPEDVFKFYLFCEKIEKIIQEYILLIEYT